MILRLSKPLAARLMGGLFLVGSTGCGPLSEQEQAYLDRRREEADMVEKFGEQLSKGEEQTEAINSVKEYQLDSGLTVEQWVKSQMVGLDGELIDSTKRWTAQNKGEDRVEVRYLFTVLINEDVPDRRGYAWTYNKLIEQVIGPRELDLGQTSYSASERRVSRQFTRHRQHAQDTLE